MRFLFDPESKLITIISRFADLAVLNLVFLLTCIPLFTIGAANTALYTVVFRMDTQREGKLLASYFRAFRENFRQSTVFWLLLVVFGAATYVNMLRFSEMSGILGYVLFLVAMLVLVLELLIASYGFPLLSQFSNSTKGTVQNALLLGIAHLPCSAALLVIYCFPWVLMLVNLYSFFRLGFLWGFFYFSAAAYINSRILQKVFQPYWDQG